MSDIKTSYKDDGNGGFAMKREQNTDSIIQQNKIDKEFGNTNKDAAMAKAGSIPMILVEQWMKEWNVTYNEFLTDPDIKRKIFARFNSPEYAHLKTFNGKV